MAFPLPRKECDLCQETKSVHVVGGEDENNTEVVTVPLDKWVNEDCTKHACKWAILTISYVLSSCKSDIFLFLPLCLS